MAGIEPAASTLARRDRSLAVTPAGRLPRSRFGLPLWCSRYGGVKNQACRRGSQGRQESNPHFAGFGDFAGSSLGKRKPPRGAFPGAVTGKCLVALTRQPFRRSGQPQAARPGSCTRLVSAPAMSSYIHGRSSPSTGQLYLPAHGEPRQRSARTPPGRPPPPGPRPRPPAAWHRRPAPPPAPGVAGGGGCGNLHPRVCTLPQPALPPGPSRGRTCRRAPGPSAPGPSAVTGHCLEKTERFNTPPAPVFPELCQVTCGWFVHKPVDNQCDVRITNRVLWATCGQRKNSK